MMLGHSDNAESNTPTTIWLDDTPCVPSAAGDPAPRRDADCSAQSAAPEMHRQHAAGIPRLDQLADIVAPHAPAGVSDQPPQLQSP